MVWFMRQYNVHLGACFFAFLTEDTLMAIMGLINRGHGIHDGEYLLVHLWGEEIMSLSRFAPEISAMSCSSLSSGFPLFPVQLTLMWNGATGQFLTVSSSFIWGYGHWQYTQRWLLKSCWDHLSPGTTCVNCLYSYTTYFTYGILSLWDI